MSGVLEMEKKHRLMEGEAHQTGVKRCSRVSGNHK